MFRDAGWGGLSGLSLASQYVPHLGGWQQPASPPRQVPRPDVLKQFPQRGRANPKKDLRVDDAG